MGRTARPSDIYRLPEHARPEPVRPHIPSAPPPPPRFPRWIAVVAVIIATALIGTGLIRAATVANTGDGPLVDVVSEDHAVAALKLYGAQASTLEKLRAREDIFEPPGPSDTAAVVADGMRRSQEALDAARKIVGADPLASGYWNSGEHTELLEEFASLHREADEIALLTNTHDTLYGGSGAIPLPQARERIIAMFTSSMLRPPIEDWGQALLEQLERQDRRDAAFQARAATGSLWAFEIKRVEPAAERLLHNYVSQLPAPTVEGLRGHPVAGPAIEILESKRGPID
jgi:hypothetical protein